MGFSPNLSSALLHTFLAYRKPDAAAEIRPRRENGGSLITTGRLFRCFL